MIELAWGILKRITHTCIVGNQIVNHLGKSVMIMTNAARRNWRLCSWMILIPSIILVKHCLINWISNPRERVLSGSRRSFSRALGMHPSLWILLQCFRRCDLDVSQIQFRLFDNVHTLTGQWCTHQRTMDNRERNKTSIESEERGHDLQEIQNLLSHFWKKWIMLGPSFS